MFIIKNSKIFFGISIALVVLSIVVTSVWGINFGIDFTGGSLLEIKYNNVSVQKNEIEKVLSDLQMGQEFSVRPTGEFGFIIKTKTLNNEQKELIVSKLSSEFSDTTSDFEEVRFNNVGPTLGKELRGKAVVAIILVVLAIMIYVAIAFSGVSKPVSSWKYGLVAIITFIHDVAVPIGLFSVLGRFYGVEVDTLFVIAILVVLGYSINDTIIVFDRIRENLKNIGESQRDQKFEEIVGKSLYQTFGRSINTSLTTLFALIALFIFGGLATKWFALALIAGILVGTYSSIFFAAPMLVAFHRFAHRKSE